MAKLLTPSEYTEKLIRRSKAASVDMERGIQAVTEAPGAAAVKKESKMLAKLTEAVQSGKWRQRTGAVTLEQWRKNALEKGIPRVSVGLDAAQEKIQSFAEEFLPFIDGLQKKVKGMPDQTLEDGIARATTWMREASKFKRSK